MEFFDDTSAVLLNALRLAAFGAAAGLTFEIINGRNAARRLNKKALFAADLLWCLSVALSFFMLLLAYADGSLCMLWFVCAAAGFFAFRRVAGKLSRRVFKTVFRFSARVRRFVCLRLFAPAVSTSKKIVIFFSKPLIFFCGCIKMTAYRLKSGRIRRKIARRKRKWLRERKKAEREEGYCSE